MPKHAAPALLVAADSFVLELNGREIAFKKGDLIEAEHPAVKKYPDLFEPIRLLYPIEDRIEQATAAPGEKRGA